MVIQLLGIFFPDNIQIRNILGYYLVLLSHGIFDARFTHLSHSITAFVHYISIFRHGHLSSCCGLCSLAVTAFWRPLFDQVIFCLFVRDFSFRRYMSKLSISIIWHFVFFANKSSGIPTIRSRWRIARIFSWDRLEVMVFVTFVYEHTFGICFIPLNFLISFVKNAAGVRYEHFILIRKIRTLSLFSNHN